MTMASHVSFPSGGRLGRRSRAFPRLVVSAVLAIAFSAVAVTLIAVGSHKGAPSPVGGLARRTSAGPPKILRSAHSARASAPTAIPVAAAPPSPVSPAPSAVAKVSAEPDAASPLIPREVKTIAIKAPAAPAGAPASAPASATAGPTASAYVPMPTPSDSGPQTAPAPLNEPIVDSSPAASPPAPVAAHASAASAAPPARRDAEAAEAALPISHEVAKTASGAHFAAYLTSSTEAQARQQLVPLQRKYGSELGGHRLSYHRMRVGGAVVYRVRAGLLSKPQADALCQKIQTAGGSCDVGPE
ncbi:MAG TPA: hypothetical protein VMU56_04535 [Beijerinckiaceae bacterium]|nr:hypothetical protein [Beijerinckiaceae bacterium]